MKSGKIQLLDLDFEYKLWKNKILFYQAELEILNARIIVLTKEFEDFALEKEDEKLLKVQKDSLIIVEKKISTLENEMSLYAQDYPINVTHTHYLNHEGIRVEMKKIILRQVEVTESIIPALCYPMFYSDSRE